MFVVNVVAETMVATLVLVAETLGVLAPIKDEPIGVTVTDKTPVGNVVVKVAELTVLTTSVPHCINNPFGSHVYPLAVADEFASDIPVEFAVIIFAPPA